MDRNQHLQLKVLIKTRINQLNNNLKSRTISTAEKHELERECENLQQNLLALNDGCLRECPQCNQRISYAYLVARPDARCCERCEEYI